MSHDALLAVVPILVGPLQVLLALAPALLAAFGGVFLALLRPATFKQSCRLLWRLKWSLLLLFALLGVGLWGVRCLVIALQPEPHDTLTSKHWEANWPAFRGGPARLGVAGSSASPAQGGVNWTYTAGARTFHASPAVAGGLVYVTSAEKGVFTDRGAIYCLDALTGGLHWKSAPPGFRATFSSPAVAGQYLVCGEGLHFTKDGRVVCLDLARGERLMWEYRTRSHVESSPCIADGRAYIGAGDDGYYCFELTPDAQGQPRLVWHVAGEQYPDAETSPIVHEGKFYAGLGLGGRALVCLDAATGKELWRVATPYPVFSPPSIAGGKLFFGMGNGNFIETADQAAVKELARLRKAGASPTELADAERSLRAAGEVWCVDLATRAVAWKFTVPEVVLGAVAADAGRVYFGARDGRVYCLDASGRELAKFDARSPIVTSPAVTESQVYVVTEAGRLFGLNKTNLQAVWELALGGKGPFLSSPVVAHGRVYVGTANNGLVCAGGADARPPRAEWAGPLGGPGRAGNVDDVPLPERGAVVWTMPALRVTAPVAAVGDSVFVPVADGPQRGLLCLPAESAQRQPPAPRWHVEVTNGVDQSPVVFDGVAYCVERAASTNARFFLGFTASNGVRQVYEQLQLNAGGQLMVGEDGPMVQLQPNQFTLPRRKGEGDDPWRNLRLPESQGLPVTSQGILVVAASSGFVAMDLRFGEPLWTAEAQVVGGPVIMDNTVCIGTGSGLGLFSLLDGRQINSLPGGEPATPLMRHGDKLAWINTQNELIVADPLGGQILANLPGARTNVPPVMVRDTLLYATATAFMVCDLTEFKPRVWLATTGLGNITAPPIIAHGGIYFATDTKGLIRAEKP